MRCCTECFQDIEIKAMISANNELGDCDYCGQKNVMTLSLEERSDLSDLVSEVLDTYEETEEGEELFSTVINHWSIFRKDLHSSKDLLASFCAVIYGDNGYVHNRPVSIPRTSAEQYGVFSGHTWKEFCGAIKEKNRFFNGYFKADQFTSFLSYMVTTQHPGNTGGTNAKPFSSKQRIFQLRNGS